MLLDIYIFFFWLNKLSNIRYTAGAKKYPKDEGALHNEDILGNSPNTLSLYEVNIKTIGKLVNDAILKKLIIISKKPIKLIIYEYSIYVSNIFFTDTWDSILLYVI